MASDDERIIRDPAILGGKPVIRGTRIAVEHVLGMLAEGMTEGQICESYPHVKPADVRACAAFAAALVQRSHHSAA